MYRVLYIEDDAFARKLVQKVLAAEGFEVVEAADGISGIRKARQCDPNIILIDIGLPDMDGYEVTLKLRGELRNKNIPIVALTGRGDREMSLAVGCDGHIHKPIDISTFASQVRNFIRGHRESKRQSGTRLLLEQGQKLAGRLQTKIEELEATNRRLVEAEKVRSEFYRNLSHELSTPLTPAIGYINMLSSEELGPLNNLQKRALNSIDKSYHQIRGVIDNLLDMTALSTGKMTFFARHYDFNKISREAVEICMDKFAENDITVEVKISKEEFRAYGDADKLKRAMIQILENGAKFCHTGGRVHVRTEQEEDEFTLLVFDSGQGIPENELTAIFHTFYQIDGSPTREHGGTGIGLALARKIIERFGGIIWAESPPRNVPKKLTWAKTLFALRVPETMREDADEPTLKIRTQH